MQITYQVNEKDYIEAQRLFRSVILPRPRRIARQFMQAVGSAFIAVAIFLFFSGRAAANFPAVAALLVCGIGITGVYAVFPDFNARRKFRADERIRREMTLDFSPAGLYARSGRMETDSPWKSFAGYAESASVFLLFLSPKLFLVFPKRAFPPSEIGPFRDLLRQNLSPMKSVRNFSSTSSS